MTQIVSSVPGRVRVRAAVLRKGNHNDHVAAQLSKLEGISHVEPNVGAGSMVLHFNPDLIDVTHLESSIDKVIEKAVQKPQPKQGRSTRMQVNRAAKIGMLGSLATSLTLAATGQKRWHAITGAVFVGCLGIHLGVHRRHLLR